MNIAAGSTDRHVQVGALCWRRIHTLEVLLIAAPGSQHWTIPKGWPQRGRLPSNSAAAEAGEEAGVVGEISKTPIGHFRYLREKDGDLFPCKVDVFSLRVTLEQETWRDAGKHERLWLPPTDAASRIAEPVLRHLLLTFLDLKGPTASR